MTRRTQGIARSFCVIVFALLALSSDWVAAVLGGVAVWMWYEARRKEDA